MEGFYLLRVRAASSVQSVWDELWKGCRSRMDKEERLAEMRRWSSAIDAT